ncbi:hypothetical protein MMPV_000972 [Pyropia vietnamensis]
MAVRHVPSALAVPRLPPGAAPAARTVDSSGRISPPSQFGDTPSPRLANEAASPPMSAGAASLPAPSVAAAEVGTSTNWAPAIADYVAHRPAMPAGLYTRLDRYFGALTPPGGGAADSGDGGVGGDGGDGGERRLSVVDLGAGTGCMARALAARGAKVVAVDVDATMLAACATLDAAERAAAAVAIGNGGAGSGGANRDDDGDGSGDDGDDGSGVGDGGVAGVGVDDGGGGGDSGGFGSDGGGGDNTTCSRSSGDGDRGARRPPYAPPLRVPVRCIVAPAESTGLPTGSFDLVTAGSAWHWFRPVEAAAEAARLLRPTGWLVIAHYDALPGAVAVSIADAAHPTDAVTTAASATFAPREDLLAATKRLMVAANPQWSSMAAVAIDGWYPAWAAALAGAGWARVETFSFLHTAITSGAAWRGRARASSAIAGGGLSAAAVDAFDAALAGWLAREMGVGEGGTLAVPHRCFVTVAQPPRRAQVPP